MRDGQLGDTVPSGGGQLEQSPPMGASVARLEDTVAGIECGLGRGKWQEVNLESQWLEATAHIRPWSHCSYSEWVVK